MDKIRKRRNRDWQSTDADRATDKQQDEKKVQQTPRNPLKYYFNRFRYYHYCFAEKVDNLIGIVFFTIMKIYFFLMGLEQGTLQLDEDINAMSMDEAFE